MSVVLELDADALWSRIEPLINESPACGLVFDADGTLWEHDVGCLVFELAYETGLLKPEAMEPLAQEASSMGISVGPEEDANAIARKLQEALLGGTYPLKRAAEMQVWAYVGFSEAELRQLCQTALSNPSHQAGLHLEVLEIKERAQALGAQPFIVSASPRVVVEEAVGGLGFLPQCIAAGEPVWEEGRVHPRLAEPLPYGPHKATAGRRLLGDAAWIATFGDSGFDLEMMAEARLAVGLGNKPELLEGLAEHAAGFRLRLNR